MRQNYSWLSTWGSRRHVLGAGGPPPVPFRPDQLGASVLFHAPWEGANAPADLAGLAQSPSAVNGTDLTKLTDWSGNGRHGAGVLGSASLIAASVGTNFGFRVTSGTSFWFGPSSPGILALPALDVTIVAVINNTGAGTLYGSQTSGSASDPRVVDSSGTGAVLFSNSPDSYNFAAPLAAGSHVLLHEQDGSELNGYLNGTNVFSKGSGGSSLVGRSLARVFSAGTGSSRWSGRLGFFAVYPRKLTSDERNQLTAWLGDEFGITVAAGFSVASPEPFAVYQRSAPGAGVVRSSGAYNDQFVSSMDARWAGGAWTPCTLSGGNWSVNIPGVEGTGMLEVRANGGAFLSSVDKVSIGQVFGGFGQSNMLGSSLNKFNFAANDSIGIYDPRPLPQPRMVDRVVGQVFGPAYDEGWIPEFLNSREVAASIPQGMTRFAIGSTRLAWWEPTAPIDGGGLGYSVQYYAEFVRACIAAQGLNPATYNPAIDPPVVEEVLVQIGEADARGATSKAAFKASLEAVADAVWADLGAHIRVSVLQDLFATGYVATEAQLLAIQEAVLEVVAAHPRVELGPDFSDVILDTSPPEGSGNVHFYTDTQVSLAAARWVAVT